MEQPTPCTDAYRLISGLITDYVYCFTVREGVGPPLHASDAPQFSDLALEWVTGRFEEVTGFTPAEFEARGGVGALIHPDDAAMAGERLGRLLAGEDDVRDFRILTKDGEVRWLRDHWRPVIDQTSGRVAAIVGAAQDITHSRRKWGKLRASRGRLNSLIRYAPVGIVQVDNDGRVTVWNPAAERIFGWTAEEMQGRPLPFIPPDKRAEASALHERDLQGEILLGLELERERKDGTRITITLSSAPVYDAGGSVVGSIAVIIDSTDRVHTEEALRVEREFSLMLLDTMPVFFVAIDAHGTTVRMNRSLLEAVEFTAEEAVGRPYLDTFVFEEDRAATAEVFRSITEVGSHSLSENRVVSKSGRTYLVEWRGRPVVRPDGTLDFFVGVGIDITERRRMEEERKKMQAQLLQVQRMESVGRLAGGVAHDFNNVLQTVGGYVEMALAEAPPESSLKQYLQEIGAAADRSAGLVRQLLAFARRQTIAPRLLDLNEQVESLLGMLSRLITEEVELSFLPGEDLDRVLLDPSQLDQLLTNLVVNASDALAGVGSIVIETGSATLDDAYCAEHPGFRPGHYVTLTVSDTGRGMDPDTLDRVFDPFFTTKVVGQGTGLGLATVYGIVKQNEGFISAYSELGHGSTFRVLLPRHKDPAEKTETGPTEVAMPAGTETVLLVEDEETILALVRRQLTRLGYQVLAAVNPREALEQAAAYPDVIHLLVTDVVMPGMDGRELCRRLQTTLPELKCLFMSGYTADVIANRGMLDEGVHFLQKPFTSAVLAAKVREALEG